ncbi:MAG: nicotinate-nucleotide adenylyltransferase [Lachnospiraceae bacterium]|nr:nicotinate-nucleotide adenylyltransferase [Lachnospiraceae bacterium]
MKIGIMGGTFNPIHYGHLLMAQASFEEFGLDKMIFIPTGLQWMKKDDPDLVSGQIRYEMTRLAIEDDPAFELSDIEIKRPGNTYTCETIAGLKELMPDNEWYYVTGADTLFNMPKWKDPEKVFDSVILICALRGDVKKDELLEFAGELKDRYGADIRFLDMPLIGLSSTDIRSRIRDKRSVRYMLPEKVRQYINEKGLYINGSGE